MKNSGNTILITGGGSGIGAALAQRFHDAGNTVIVAGRRAEPLEETIAGRDRMHAVTLDVDDARGLKDAIAALLSDHPALNVVIANAGIMRIEKADAARDLADAEATVATNLLGPIRLIDALVDHLSEQPDAAIVTVTSGLATVPLMDFPTYCATKAAMHSYTVALRGLLEGRVELIELIPPGVQTTLTPGQENRPGYMPLEDYADAVFAQFQQQPTPREILVDQSRFLRDAEREGRYDDTFRKLNEQARAARAA